MRTVQIAVRWVPAGYRKAALDIRLTDDDLKALDRALRPPRRKSHCRRDEFEVTAMARHSTPDRTIRNAPTELSERHEVRVRGRNHTIAFIAGSQEVAQSTPQCSQTHLIFKSAVAIDL
jgi:hypothetical protein